MTFMHVPLWRHLSDSLTSLHSHSCCHCTQKDILPLLANFSFTQRELHKDDREKLTAAHKNLLRHMLTYQFQRLNIFLYNDCIMHNFLVAFLRNTVINNNFDHLIKNLSDSCVQCCGSVVFWYGSGCGSGRPKHTASGSGTLVHFHHASKLKKVIKKSQNSINQCFPYYFCLMMEGSGAISVSVINGSGCRPGRPKNLWILRNRIRFRTTACVKSADHE